MSLHQSLRKRILQKVLSLRKSGKKSNYRKVRNNMYCQKNKKVSTSGISFLFEWKT